MLCRALKFLLDSKDQYARDWLVGHCRSVYGSELTALSVSNNKLHIALTTEDGSAVVQSWPEFEIITSLESSEQLTEATLAAWSLCRFLDREGDSTAAMLREFVKSETGVTLEPVPFTVEKDSLATLCEQKFCKGTPKNSENASLSVDKERLLVILPSTNTALRQLFFKRLRRISA